MAKSINNIVTASKNIINAAKMLGFPGSVDPGDLFNNMHMTIKNLRKMVDKGRG